MYQCMASIIQFFPLHLVPAELIFLCFLHSNDTENYTENSTLKLKIQQQEEGATSLLFSVSDQPFP